MIKDNNQFMSLIWFHITRRVKKSDANNPAQDNKAEKTNAALIASRTLDKPPSKIEEIKKGWLSDLEILEINKQINRGSSQEDPNTIIDTLHTEKQKPSKRS